MVRKLLYVKEHFWRLVTLSGGLTIIALLGFITVQNIQDHIEADRALKRAKAEIPWTVFIGSGQVVHAGERAKFDPYDAGLISEGASINFERTICTRQDPGTPVVFAKRLIDLTLQPDASPADAGYTPLADARGFIPQMVDGQCWHTNKMALHPSLTVGLTHCHDYMVTFHMSNTPSSPLPFDVELQPVKFRVACDSNYAVEPK